MRLVRELIGQENWDLGRKIPGNNNHWTIKQVTLTAVDEIIVVRDSRICLSFPPFFLFCFPWDTYFQTGIRSRQTKEGERLETTPTMTRGKDVRMRSGKAGSKEVDKLQFGFVVFVGGVSGKTPTLSSHFPSLLPTCICVLPSSSKTEKGNEGKSWKPRTFRLFFV